MLINEIGRFGDNIEDMKPIEIKSEIPQKYHQIQIGIFWHLGNNKWIIRRVPLFSDDTAIEMGQDYDQETNPDDLQIDYNFFHKEVWLDWCQKNQEYAKFRFDHFSRGRLLYEVDKESPKIFLPKGLEQEAANLAKVFELPDFAVDTQIYKAKEDAKTVGTDKFTYILF